LVEAPPVVGNPARRVVHAFGRLPKRGDTVTIGEFRFRIVRADSRRIHTLQVEKIAAVYREFKRKGVPAEVAGFCKAATLDDIREHMDVYASCGTKVGSVDHVEGDTIRLTKRDSPDGQHHRIPLSWVAKVHGHVHLDRDSDKVHAEWQPA